MSAASRGQVSPSEAELIQRVLGGHDEAFRDLMRPHEHAVFMTTRGILKNEADAEDAAQEAVLKAFTNLVKFRGDRILSELSESLARYAQNKMEARGVRFRLNARLTDAQPGVVVLSDGEISAATLVWTAGTAPNPLLKSLPFEKDRRGAILVDATLAVTGHTGLWALGDCAAVSDAKTGERCPPTAQFAIRQADVLAKNIQAQLKGRRTRTFHFDSLGALCVVGHQTACAELTVPFARTRSLRFSGFLAWLMWRGIYLSKLPGIERKTRVLMDWTVELFFPRDIVQTIDLQ